jgi:hypothetical protein
MEQFLVPQFIDVEDKIIGPITTRQFVLILAAILLTFIFYKLLAFLYFVFVGFITLAIFAILAFAKVNGRPVHFFLLNFIQTTKRPGLRVWNRETYVRDVKKVEKGKDEDVVVETEQKEAVSGSHLRDLTLVINTGGVYDGEQLELPE